MSNIKTSQFVSMFRYWATGPDKTQIQDSQEADRLFTKYRRQILFFLTFGYGAYYVCRLVMSVVKKPLIDQGVFTATELGLIGSAIFYGYAIGKFTNGFLADHSNTRKFMATGLLVSAVCNITMGCSTALSVFIITWGVNGWFQSFGAPASVVTLSHWFSNRERGTFYGIWSSSHSIGEGITFLGVAVLVEYWGWRSGFVGAGVFCLVIAVLLSFFLKDRPRTLGLPNVADWKNDHVVQANKNATTFACQLQVFRNPAVWVLVAASTAMYITRYAINNWGILYLQEARGMNIKSAATLMVINTVAGVGGSVAYGFISDKIFSAKRPPVNLLYAILEIVALITIFYLPLNNYWLLAGAFAIYGFTLSGLLAVLGGLFAIDIVSRKASGAVLGFVGIFSYIGAAMQEQISGWLIDKNSELVDGVMRYDFSEPILFWVGASIVSMILAASLWKVQMKE